MLCVNGHATYHRFSDGADEALRAPSTRDSAEFDLGLPKDSVLASVEDIAHQGELTTAS